MFRSNIALVRKLVSTSRFLELKKCFFQVQSLHTVKHFSSEAAPADKSASPFLSKAKREKINVEAPKKVSKRVKKDPPQETRVTTKSKSRSDQDSKQEPDIKAPTFIDKKILINDATSKDQDQDHNEEPTSEIHPAINEGVKNEHSKFRKGNYTRYPKREVMSDIEIVNSEFPKKEENRKYQIRQAIESYNHYLHKIYQDGTRK